MMDAVEEAPMWLWSPRRHGVTGLLPTVDTVAMPNIQREKLTLIIYCLMSHSIFCTCMETSPLPVKGCKI
jgi:hypothetical protein